MYRHVTRHVKNVLRTACAVAAMFATRAVDAATLNTAVLRSNLSTFVDYQCIVTNIGTKPVNGTITFFNTAGTQLGGVFTFPNLAPGATASFGRAGTQAGGARCLVSGDFSKKNVLVTLQLLDTGSGITQVVVPGQ
jgi:hypothetical protein